MTIDGPTPDYACINAAVRGPQFALPQLRGGFPLSARARCRGGRCRVFAESPLLQTQLPRERDHRLEEPDRAVPLEDYAEPTAKAFGYLIGLLANAIRKPEHLVTFQSIGRHVGRAIIAFDCAADKQRDSQLPAESSWKPNPTVLC